MRHDSSRRWIAWVVMAAMLLNTAALGEFCLCKGCSCARSISRLLPIPAVAVKKCAVKKCCCSSPESVPSDNCCGSPQAPCPCKCGDVHTDKVTALTAVLSDKMPNMRPAWNLISVLPVNVADVPKRIFSIDDPRTLLPPHVPLHVLLCVFLN